MDTPPAPVGASVHYVNGQGRCCAATVSVSYDDSRRDLRVHHQGELSDRQAVPFDPTARPITWHTFDKDSNPGCLLIS